MPSFRRYYWLFRWGNETFDIGGVEKEALPAGVSSNQRRAEG